MSVIPSINSFKTQILQRNKRIRYMLIYSLFIAWYTLVNNRFTRIYWHGGKITLLYPRRTILGFIWAILYSLYNMAYHEAHIDKGSVGLETKSSTNIKTVLILNWGFISYIKFGYIIITKQVKFIIFRFNLWVRFHFNRLVPFVSHLRSPSVLLRRKCFWNRFLNRLERN